MIYLKVPVADKDVLDLVEDVYVNKAKKKIDKLIAHLNNADKDINRNYFAQLTKDNAKPNRIHRLFHPSIVERLNSIYAKTKPTVKAKRIESECLVPYLISWDRLFKSMRHYYGEEASLNDALAAYHLMVHESRVFVMEEGDTEHGLALLPNFNKAAYVKQYEVFCGKFEQLPSNPLPLTNQQLASLVSPATAYTAVYLSPRARTFIFDCDQNKGVVGIKGVGTFYVSPQNTTAWEIIRQLVKGEYSIDDGFVQVQWPSKKVKWQSAFSGNAAKPPANSNYLTVKELYNYIHPRPNQRSGYFRIENTPKKKPKTMP